MLPPLARSLIQVAVRTSDRSRRPSGLLHATHVTCSRTLLGSRMLREAKQPWPARPNPTRPQGSLVLKLLSELIARARMLRPNLGSRLVSAPLTVGVHCHTLSGEEQCGRMIANSVISTCTSYRQLPNSRSVRLPMLAFSRCTARLILRSWQ